MAVRVHSLICSLFFMPTKIEGIGSRHVDVGKFEMQKDLSHMLKNAAWMLLIYGTLVSNYVT